MYYHSAPHLLEKYEKFDDRDEFEIIKLTCDVGTEYLTKTDSTYGKLTLVVT